MGLKIPDLDNITFEQLVEQARLLIGRYGPEWTDHNVHDPGITFIEIFAWLAEMQIYHLDQITDAQYETFLKLVGMGLKDAQPAAVDITFKNVTGKVIDAGTSIITEMGTERIVFETQETVTLLPLALESVKTVINSQTIDHTAANKKEDIYFPAFGKKAPKGAELLLGFDRQFPAKDLHLVFELLESDLPLVGKGRQIKGYKPLRVLPSVELAWECLAGGTWKPLQVKKDTTLALNKSGQVILTGPGAMDLKENNYWIRCRLSKGQYELVPMINRVLLNTVTALQVEETIEDELLGEGNPSQVLKVKKKPVIKGSLVLEVESGTDQWNKWEMKEDFESSGPKDHHYMFNAEKGEITFGNGLNGLIPQTSQRIQASYKTTLGYRGNIPKNQSFYIDNPEGIQGTNLKAAAGGSDAEPIKKAISRARKDFKTTYRGITSRDYETLTLETPGLRVARAKAIPNFNPHHPCIPVPGTVTVVVVPYAREGTVTPVPGEGFLQTVQNHLDRHRLVTTDLHVIAPEYIKVSIDCQVKLKKKSSPVAVKARVQKALKEFLDPLSGGPDKTGWPFGRAVYPSEIYQLIDNLEGVDYASGISLGTEEKQYEPGQPVKISSNALIFSGEHHVEVIEKDGEVGKRQECKNVRR